MQRRKSAGTQVPLRGARRQSSAGRGYLAQSTAVSNQIGQHFSRTCPLGFPSPGFCSFGGTCHPCPAELHVNGADHLEGNNEFNDNRPEFDHYTQPPAPVNTSSAAAHTPLNDNLRKRWEDLLSLPLNFVTVNTNPTDVKRLNAKGFAAQAQGADISLPAACHPPRSRSATAILGHEVAHAVQQTLFESAAASHEQLEKEADSAGLALSDGKHFKITRGSPESCLHSPLLIPASTELATVTATYEVIPAYPPLRTSPPTILYSTAELVPDGEVPGAFNGFPNIAAARRFAEENSNNVVAILVDRHHAYHVVETGMHAGSYLLVHTDPIPHSNFQLVELVNLSTRPEGPDVVAMLGGQVTIDALGMPNSNFTIARDIAFANSVFNRCSIIFRLNRQLGPNEMEPASQDQEGPEDWLGSDLEMGWSRTCGEFHPDELRTYNGTRQRFGLNGSIQVYYVQRLNPPTNPAFSEYQECAGRNIRMAVFANGSSPRNFAHEMGHILINTRQHHGIDDPSDLLNLMVQSSQTTGTAIDESQCRRIRRNL